jgi:hypothetical protein
LFIKASFEKGGGFSVAEDGGFTRLEKKDLKLCWVFEQRSGGIFNPARNVHAKQTENFGNFA